MTLLITCTGTTIELPDIASSEVDQYPGFYSPLGTWLVFLAYYCIQDNLPLNPIMLSFIAISLDGVYASLKAVTILSRKG